MTLVPVTRSIQLDEKELHEDFLRSSGPGGQNVKLFCSITVNAKPMRSFSSSCGETPPC
jgi:protein subunit release factor B